MNKVDPKSGLAGHIRTSCKAQIAGMDAAATKQFFLDWAINQKEATETEFPTERSYMTIDRKKVSG